jgi:hypothetical protein
VKERSAASRASLRRLDQPRVGFVGRTSAVHRCPELRGADGSSLSWPAPGGAHVGMAKIRFHPTGAQRCGMNLYAAADWISGKAPPKRALLDLRGEPPATWFSGSSRLRDQSYQQGIGGQLTLPALILARGLRRATTTRGSALSGAGHISAEYSISTVGRRRERRRVFGH